MHTSVLLKEVIDSLNITEGGKYIDATFGTGGHAREILKRGGTVLAIDWDEENVETRIKSNEIRSQKNLRLVWGNFADIESIAIKNGFEKVEGVLFDFGLSMDQIGMSGRGFSYKKLLEPLDMRISKKGTTITAEQIINNSSSEELYEIFSRNSQEIDSRPIAEVIFRARCIKPMVVVGDLINALTGVKGAFRSSREAMFRKVFQAIRMEVNCEIESIRRGLAGATAVTKSGGRIAIISFHQTEDRAVKQESLKLNLKSVNKKPITAHNDNRFEQSAKLRIFEVQS